MWNKIKYWWRTRDIRKHLRFQAKQAKAFGKWVGAQDPLKFIKDKEAEKTQKKLED